ncbi:uncharacterized protein LOC142818434 isoform X1 [Pelodiscus sinensis]|uniref:uncharacterized protein LOC142818434 isoform X1 n=1 Tax=Pelodiscus sinensis TaxID=13735 RepID=UPI003F6CB43E
MSTSPTVMWRSGKKVPSCSRWHTEELRYTRASCALPDQPTLMSVNCPRWSHTACRRMEKYPLRLTYWDAWCSGAQMGMCVPSMAPPQLGKPRAPNPWMTASGSARWTTLRSSTRLMALTTCGERHSKAPISGAPGWLGAFVPWQCPAPHSRKQPPWRRVVRPGQTDPSGAGRFCLLLPPLCPWGGPSPPCSPPPRRLNGQRVPYLHEHRSDGGSPHAELVPDGSVAVGHGELPEGDGHLLLEGDGGSHASVPSAQGRGEPLAELQEGVPPHPKVLGPLSVLPALQDDAVPPVGAGVQTPDAAGHAGAGALPRLLHGPQGGQAERQGADVHQKVPGSLEPLVAGLQQQVQKVHQKVQGEPWLHVATCGGPPRREAPTQTGTETNALLSLGEVGKQAGKAENRLSRGVPLSSSFR